ncbi:benzoate/H(+) symporter BenE family transporter [Lichenibacterium dinghuense]|uniref:benzoate/H(+) symporter BenE family transporter n=1 Tax=Lichenibacterium dinghuense TaxID=2895977 RepID=UPI001EFF970A|nr:benzoate/H(+) symporter BenE family transporter [Lichenibacterium sp. 6Y81]
MSSAATGAAPLSPPGGSWLQPATSGLLGVVVGFASSFTLILAGLARVGATPAQAASGLLVVCLAIGVIAFGFAFWRREPIAIAWSTPGAALLIATGLPTGGYPAAVGAFLFAGALIVVAGLWPAFGRLVGAIPRSLASAMLAGILFTLCLAPVRAVAEMPALAAPVVLAWALAWRFARPYAVPLAFAVAAAAILSVAKFPAGLSALGPPALSFAVPAFVPATLGSLGLPLFIVTMASQNVPGLAVLSSNGYRPPTGPIFVATGLGSGVSALFGGVPVNLAAITAALCAGPESHPDPSKRWYSTVVYGAGYVVVALCTGAATALVTAAPPLLIEAVAGLALLGSLGGALTAALADERERLPAVVTFAVAASGVAAFGIGAPFWALLAGGALLALERWR